ncbi:MAG: indolepyruvate oxidoreductase subunit beta [Endomicrobiaceae bacterium]
MKTINILFCGTGGQGILTAAEIAGLAAMYDGYHVKKSEVHGMAQRGGSVESHLRFGKEVFSPIITDGEVDFMLSFDKGEHDRMIKLLKKDGKDLFPDFVEADKKIADKKFLNTYMLGILSKHLGLSKESWQKAMKDVFKTKFIEKNFEVFNMANGDVK